MPRNVAKPVSAHDAYHAAKVRRHIAPLTRNVALTYLKRDNSVSRSVGTVTSFCGKEGMDTHSVTILTADKGPRTINLHRVTKVE